MAVSSAKLTVETIRNEWAKVTLTKGVPVKYHDQELWFPNIYVRLAGMDDILSIKGLTDDRDNNAAIESLLKMTKVLSCEGCTLNEDGTLSDPVYPDSNDILSIYMANVKRRDVKPKDFVRVSKAFKIVNDLEEEDPSDFLVIPGMVEEKVEEDE